MCKNAVYKQSRSRPEDSSAGKGECCRYELFLHALANSRRFALLGKLRDGELSVTELAQWIGLTQPTVSHHLGILRRAGLVEVHTEGRWAFYTANTDCLATCCRQLVDQLGVPLVERDEPDWKRR